jgi:hypothetical protein
MENDEKPEMSVMGYDNPSLEADEIDSSTESEIDSALDNAIASADETETKESYTTEEKSAIEETEEPSEESGSLKDFQSTTPNEIAEDVSEIDEEIRSIEQPRNLSEKNQSNWRKLQETASQYKKQAQEAEQLKQKLKEYESKPQAPSDYEELRKFRALFDIASDPDFQSKYDKPIFEAKNNIYAILKKHGANDDVIKSIEAKGGPDKVDQKWWLDNAISKLPFTDAERLKRNLVDVADLNEKKISEIEKTSLNVDSYYQQKDQDAVNWFQTQESEAIKYIQDKIKEQNADWAVKKPIPKNASKDQIEAIKSHNNQVEQLETFFTSALFPQTPQERADVAAAASLSHVLTNQLRVEQTQKQKMLAQIETLQKENARLKTSGKAPKQNSAVQSNGNRSTLISDRLKMSSADAIDLGLEEAGA